jgi:hypothetical protein
MTAKGRSQQPPAGEVAVEMVAPEKRPRSDDQGLKSREETPKEGCPEGPRTPAAAPAKLMIRRV